MHIHVYEIVFLQHLDTAYVAEPDFESALATANALIAAERAKYNYPPRIEIKSIERLYSLARVTKRRKK